MSATRPFTRFVMPSLRALRFRTSMNGGWLSTATMRAGELCASTSVWAPVPQPTSSTRVRGPTPGTSPRARRVLAVVPGPCRGSPLNSSKNSAVSRSGAMIASADGLRMHCARMLATTGGEDTNIYALVWRGQIAPGTDQVGTVQAISVETGETTWKYDQRAATMSLVATGAGW